MVGVETAARRVFTTRAFTSDAGAEDNAVISRL